MPVDFSALVLSPCMNTFAIAVMINPIKSQPLAAPYPARGVFSSDQTSVMLENGAVLSDQVTTLGIRRSDKRADGTPMWVALPMRGDGCVTLDAAGVPVENFWVADIDADGQGGHMLSLRKEKP
jgi:hypothetical protein